MNFEQARFNMVEQQVRTWEVLDPKVLDVLSEVPREAFVPESAQGLAYADTQIPLGHGEKMMPPVVEARMVQALNIQISDSILEVGTGSGYVTALLAKLGHHVDSMDIVEDFIKSAEQRLDAQGIRNVALEASDATRNFGGRHYDAIAITASLPVMEEKYQQLLSVGGRMFVIVGEAPVMEAMLITRIGETEFRHESLFETCIDELKNTTQPQQFEF